VVAELLVVAALPVLQILVQAVAVKVLLVGTAVRVLLL
jgi:hypothetical protein